MEKTEYQSKSYQRARKAYIILCALAYMIELMIDDAFLSKLLLTLGLAKSEIGLISSIVSLSFIIQLFSLPLLTKKISFKKTTMFIDTAGLLVFSLLFLLPFFNNNPLTKAMAYLLFLIGFFIRRIVSGISFRWTNSFVDPCNRGVYSAVKEIVSLLVGIFFTLAIAWVFDILEKAGKTNTAFLVFAVAILLCSAGVFVCYALIPEGHLETSSGHPLKTIFTKTIFNKSFLPIILLSVLWEAGRYFTLGFLGVFKTETLGFSLFQVQLINNFSCLPRIFIAKPFGRYSDRHSFAGGIELGLLISLAAFGCIVFTTPATRYLMIAFYALYMVGQAGLNQNFFNISYHYVESDYVSEAMAIRGAVGGMFGFLSAAAAKYVFDVIEARGIFGLSPAPQQVLAVVSCLLIAAAALYDHFVVRKLRITAA